MFSYVLIALSEILTSITGLEYSFTMAPRNMRSLVASVLLFTGSLSAAVGEAFVCKSFSTGLRYPWAHVDHVHSPLR